MKKVIIPFSLVFLLLNSITAFAAQSIKEQSATDKKSEKVKAKEEKANKKTTEKTQQKQKKNDPVVISVDGRPITKSEIEKGLIYFIGKKKKMSKSKFLEYREEIEKFLIQRELLRNEAEKRKISISDEEYEKSLDETLKKSNKTKEDLKGIIKERNITMDEFKNRYTDEMKRNKLFKQLEDDFRKEIKISDEEAQKFYEQHKKMFIKPERVEVEHILIKTSKSDSKEELEKKKKELEKIRERILKGEKFETLAKNFSDCPSRKNGGYLGIIQKGQTVPEFEQMAFSSKEGEISPVFKTQFGYHILKVIKKYPYEQVPFEKAKPYIVKMLKNNKIRDKFEEYLKGLNAKANIKIYEENQPKYEDLVPPEKRAADKKEKGKKEAKNEVKGKSNEKKGNNKKTTENKPKEK